MTDIMPLVNELHDLRNENKVLRAALAEQGVRIDQMLEHPVHPGRIEWLPVRLDQLTMMMDPEKQRRATADGLAHVLLRLQDRMARKTLVQGSLGGDIEMVFAFHPMGSAK